MVDNPSVFWAVIISMYIGNVVLLILNLPLIPYIAKLLTIPRNYLIPFILFFTMVGAYIGQNNATELLILVGLGVCATILRFADYPLAPLLIGFILAGMLEDNFARAVNLTDGLDGACPSFRQPVHILCVHGGFKDLLGLPAGLNITQAAEDPS